MSKRKVISKRKQMIGLPSAMVEIIKEMNVSRIQKNHMFNILRLFISKSRKEKMPLDSKFEFPALYFEKSIGHRYSNALKPLIQSGVILIISNYSTELHKCRLFRLNPALLGDELVLVPIEIYYKKNVVSDSESNELGVDITDPNLPECIYTRKILKKLKLDVRAAKKKLAEHLQPGQFDRFVIIDPDLPFNQVIPITNYKDLNLRGKYMKVISIKLLPIDASKKILNDRDKYYIDDPEKFLKLKRAKVKQSYESSISNFKSPYLYAHRNSTNYRLDSNITSFPELLMPFVSIEKRPLVSMDLKNAQFAILARLFEKGEFIDYTPDIKIDPEIIDLGSVLQKKPKNFSRALMTASIKNHESFTCLSSSYYSYYFFSNIFLNSLPYSILHPVHYCCAYTIPPLTSKWLSLLSSQLVPAMLHLHSVLSLPLYFSQSSNLKFSIYIFCTFHQNPCIEQSETPVFTDDVELFINLAKSGKLYEYIQKTLNLPKGASGRTLAKTMMFEVCFSSRLNQSSMKKQLKLIFPNVVAIIDEYKKRNGDNQFSILLQKTEANIFIDKIFKRLQQEGYFVLTKHDSILCSESQKMDVERIVREVLDEELGVYELDVKQYSRD